MNEIVPFRFQGAPVRVVTIDGEPWWVAADVCRVLEIGNPRQAVSYLDDDEVTRDGVTTNDAMGRPQKMTTVSEPGLYSLILRSRKPQAKAFKRWITHEVIPQIRKHGSYGAPREMTKLEALRAAIEAEEARLAAESRAAVAERQVLELEPKARAHDTYLAVPDGGRLVREVAKLLGWKEQALRGFLVDQGLVFRRKEPCGAARWDFYAKNRDHFGAVEHPVKHTWGDCTHYTLFVTPRGVDLIQRRIDRQD
ncbi:phage antirepressor [Frankia sp. CeD]|uniref:phage antirepressor n=1 Tax=Frankia sp. CeD TaxID=258230 RepID=UPI0004DD4C70|nr:phage antirepressor [Frankia sp. CeD]KEZ35831.1 phage antirepressor KilAC-like protein,BRO family protein [Frankia sp. CeD]